MVETGKEILQKNNVTDLSDVRWATHQWYIFYFTALHIDS